MVPDATHLAKILAAGVTVYVMGSQGFITCVISDLMAIIQTIKPNKLGLFHVPLIDFY